MEIMNLDNRFAVSEGDHLTDISLWFDKPP